MIKVVLDTNIIVSAALARDGNPALVFELFLFEKIINYTTKEILEEIKKVLRRARLKLSTSQQEFMLEKYKEYSRMIEKISTFNLIKEDKDDNKFLECAFDARVDYIISGDQHLLKIKEFQGIKIITPTEFLKIVHELSDQNSE